MIDLFRESSLELGMVRYFSTQNRLFPMVGSSLGIENTFAVMGMNTNENNV